ncbi:putative NADH-ubiquinone oxidoreductase subunit [Clavispora lusitaniae]|uniref:CENP-S associating Centromere protein n=2 Tax=Clavispora lusitaniae TaxID=36911 RepID=A0AA91PYH6_CLALS|nr:hypothetical protein E0198_003751 [Clavispora lusitaniae]KAF7581460.1 CENP-S associating Centromere protein X family protein [Clavispora lusitaniae]OVF07706.1 putative CENP-S associating Centromere protein [Clavispora lusitaniae]QFZ28869.1 putative NADH-ubiquinone oxidoreductase subunit [Clavispora lusitaniae]QFZ40217.1 putative NADH-ubiquinone oxidoreductase subunit [Clavispora lusitaniae]
MIPPETVARVFQEVAFKRSGTRMSAKSLALSTEYIRLFVEEAILRSNAQRLAEDSPTVIDGIDNIQEENEANESFEEENERGSGVSTQIPTDLASDTLDTRQLASVAGLLVLDF